MWIVVEWTREKSVSVLKEKDIARNEDEKTKQILVGETVDVPLSGKNGFSIHTAKVMAVFGTKSQALDYEKSLTKPVEECQGKRKRKPTEKLKDMDGSSISDDDTETVCKKAKNKKSEVNERNVRKQKQATEISDYSDDDCPENQQTTKKKKTKKRNPQPVNSDSDDDDHSPVDKKTTKKKQTKTSTPIPVNSDSDGDSGEDTQVTTKKKKPKKINHPPLQDKVQQERVSNILSQRRFSSDIMKQQAQRTENEENQSMTLNKHSTHEQTPQPTLHQTPQQTPRQRPQQAVQQTPQPTLDQSPHLTQRQHHTVQQRPNQTPQPTLHQTLQQRPQQMPRQRPQQAVQQTPQQTPHLTQQRLHQAAQQRPQPALHQTQQPTLHEQQTIIDDDLYCTPHQSYNPSPSSITPQHRQHIHMQPQELFCDSSSLPFDDSPKLTPLRTRHEQQLHSSSSNTSMVSLLNGDDEDFNLSFESASQHHDFQGYVMAEFANMKAEISALKVEIRNLRKKKSSKESSNPEAVQDEANPQKKLQELASSYNEPKVALRQIIFQVFTKDELKNKTVKGVKTWKCGDQPEALDSKKLEDIFCVMQNQFNVQREQTKTWIRNIKRGLKK